MATYQIQTANGTYEVETADTPGMLESAGRGAMNNFPLAKQAAAAFQPGSYSENLADLNQKAAAAKEENPISYGAGAVAGAVAPLAIPGAGAALKASPVAGNALLGAAQSISDTDLLKHPFEAAKQALQGGGIGAALGHLLPSGEGAAEGLEDYANTKTVQSMGMKPQSLGVSGEEIQDKGHMAHELGFDVGPLEDRFNAAHDAVQQAGKQIEDLGAGRVLKDAMAPGLELSKHALDSLRVYGEGNPETKMFLKAAENLRPNMPFEDLQDLKNLYGDKGFFPSGQVKNEAAAKIYSVISDAMENVVSDHPDYPELKQAYSSLKDMKDGLEGLLQKEQSGGMQAKGFGMVGKLGGMITGGNVPATAGLAAALAPAHPFMAVGAASTILTNPSAMASAARGLGEAIPVAAQAVKAGSIDAVTSSIMNALQTNPQTLGKYAAPLSQAAQQGGNQGIAATHFILSNTHPEYNELMHHLAIEGAHHGIHKSIEGENDNAE